MTQIESEVIPDEHRGWSDRENYFNNQIRNLIIENLVFGILLVLSHFQLRWVRNSFYQIEILVRIFAQILKFWVEIDFCFSEMEILVNYQNFGQKLNFCSNIKILGRYRFFPESLVKYQNFGQKLKFWSKIEILVKNWNFGQKSNFLFKYWNFDQISKFSLEIELLFEKSKVWSKFDLSTWLSKILFFGILLIWSHFQLRFKKNNSC